MVVVDRRVLDYFDKESAQILEKRGKDELYAVEKFETLRQIVGVNYNNSHFIIDADIGFGGSIRRISTIYHGCLDDALTRLFFEAINAVGDEQFNLEINSVKVPQGSKKVEVPKELFREFNK
ncbi:MAG: hypothetical protein ABIF88_03630 [archaeon]